MGYTHTSNHTAEIATRTWGKICADARKIFAVSPVKLADGSGDEGTAPEITRDAIVFNGERPGTIGYETFVLTRTPDSFFCKTARKPYDPVVCAVLLAAASRAVGLHVGSDGTREDWAAGLALCALAGVEVNAARALRNVETQAERDERNAARAARMDAESAARLGKAGL